MKSDGGMTLVAARKKTGTVREHQRLLRTNLINWGVELPAKQGTWLRLVDDAGVENDGEEEAKTEQHDATSSIQVVNEVTQFCASIPAQHSMETGFRLQLPKNLLYRSGERFAVLHQIPIATC